MSTQPNSDQPESSPHPLAELVVTDIEKEIHKKILDEFELMRKPPCSIEQIKEHGEKAIEYGKQMIDEVNKRDPEIMIRRKKNANNLPEDQKILFDKAIEELKLSVESSNSVQAQHYNNFKAYIGEVEKLRNERKMAEAIEKVENLNVDDKKEDDETVQQNPN